MSSSAFSNIQGRWYLSGSHLQKKTKYSCWPFSCLLSPMGRKPKRKLTPSFQSLPTFPIYFMCFIHFSFLCVCVCVLLLWNWVQAFHSSLLVTACHIYYWIHPSLFSVRTCFLLLAFFPLSLSLCFCPITMKLLSFVTSTQPLHNLLLDLATTFLCLHACFLVFRLLVFASLLANMLLLVKIWLQHHFASNILTASRNTLLHFLLLLLAQAYGRIRELDK